MRDMKIRPKKLKTETKMIEITWFCSMEQDCINWRVEQKAATSLVIKTFCIIWKSSVICMIFTSGSVVKNPPANAGDAGLIPGSGRSPGERNGNPLWYSCLETSMDRGAWWASVHGVAKIRTQLRCEEKVQLIYHTFPHELPPCN